MIINKPQKAAYGESMFLVDYKSRIKGAIKKVPGSHFFLKKPEDPRCQFGKISFSQTGEDLIIDYIFNLRGLKYPSYVDIGANHPFYLNNTALFYLKGCRGINIEANPSLIEQFNKFRGEDINLNFGVGVADDIELDFFVLNDPTLSTFSMDEVERFLETKKYSFVETRKIKIYTLDSLLKRYFAAKSPDFISIDVEGLDFEIVKTIDFEFYKPKLICTESHDYSPTGSGKRRKELIEFIISKGYHEYADTGLNSIFVRNDFWFI